MKLHKAHISAPKEIVGRTRTRVEKLLQDTPHDIPEPHRRKNKQLHHLRMMSRALEARGAAPRCSAIAKNIMNKDGRYTGTVQTATCSARIRELLLQDGKGTACCDLTTCATKPQQPTKPKPLKTRKCSTITSRRTKGLAKQEHRTRPPRGTDRCNRNR